MLKGTAIRLLRRYLVNSRALDGVPRGTVLTRAAKANLTRYSCTRFIVRELIDRVENDIYPYDAVKAMKDVYERTLVTSLDEQLVLHNHCAVCISILNNIQLMFEEYDETQVNLDRRMGLLWDSEM